MESLFTLSSLLQILSFILAAPQILPNDWIRNLQWQHGKLKKRIPKWRSRFKKIFYSIYPQIIAVVSVIAMIFFVLIFYGLRALSLMAVPSSESIWTTHPLNWIYLLAVWLYRVDYGIVAYVSFYMTLFGIPIILKTIKVTSFEDNIAKKFLVTSLIRKIIFSILTVSITVPMTITVLALVVGALLFAVVVVVAAGIPLIFIYFPFVFLRQALSIVWMFILTNSLKRIALIVAFVLLVISICVK